MPEEVKKEIKITTKREKLLYLILIIVGFILLILIISPIVLSLPPEILFLIVAGVMGYAVLQILQKKKKKKRLRDILYEVADEVYEMMPSTVGIDTDPRVNEVYPLGSGEYLVYLGSLRTTFYYDENVAPFGERLIPLYKVKEDLETSGLFKELRARQKAERQLKELQEKLGIEIESTTTG